MAIGAFIHDFIPQGSLESVLKEFGYFGVVIAAFVALLLYIRVEAIIPIGLGLINAGVPLGVIMSLLIAGGGCSLPELILLKYLYIAPFIALYGNGTWNRNRVWLFCFSIYIKTCKESSMAIMLDSFIPINATFHKVLPKARLHY